MNLRKDHYHTIQTLHTRESVAGSGRPNRSWFLAATININQKTRCRSRSWLRGRLTSCSAAQYQITLKLNKNCRWDPSGFFWLYNLLQLSAMDVLDPTTMKNAAKCDTTQYDTIRYFTLRYVTLRYVKLHNDTRRYATQ